jgi:uncharacterized membrane protein HdeD (DUF308 family)
MSSSPLSPSLLPEISPRWSHGWSTALSVVLILLGLIAVTLPQIGGLAVALYFGWLLLLGGVALMVFAWRTHAAGVMSLQVLLGAVYVLIGGFLITRPAAGLASLTLLLTGYLLIEGLLELTAAFRVQPRAGRTWLVIDGVVALVLAVMIVTSWPSSAAWVVGTLVGINMIIGGVSRLMVTNAVRRHVGVLGI